MNTLVGVLIGFFGWFVVRHGLFGLYTVGQNERAVITSFGRAERLGDRTTLDTPIAASLRETEKERYAYPQLRVIGPGLYFKFPWQRVYKVSVATQTCSIAFDPENRAANLGGVVLEAVTKDQLNTGLTGQLRYTIAEQNLYAYLFGVKNPVAHVMGYFVSILRERIANFEAPAPKSVDYAVAPKPAAATDSNFIQGISINDLRKNLRDLNEHMDHECVSSTARYGISLDAALITEINPPADVESALAAINTAHNHASSEISLAQAGADQKIVQSKRAVEIETLKAQAEIEPLKSLAGQLARLKEGGRGSLRAYLRNLRLSLYAKARRLILEARD